MRDREAKANEETCAYVMVDGRKVHYRRRGEGPPLVMLHASPLSSASLRPAMEVFASDFCCIALDTPGFGLSDPISSNKDDIFAYADALKSTIDALGLERPIVYGASTGAAITHALGCRYPHLASLLMLDTFSHHDTDDMLEGYFLDQVPSSSGAHLLQAWEKSQGLFLFSPWQRTDSSRRQIRTLPNENIVHEMAMQLLAAGSGYEQVYRAAIAWEDKDNVDKLKAPATINFWLGGSNIERLQVVIDQGLPDNFSLISSPAVPNGRYLSQLQYLKENGFADQPAISTTHGEQVFQTRERYVETAFGQVHLLASGADGAAPVLLLHDLGGSAIQLDDLVTALGKNRRVIAPDLPSHGSTPAEVTSISEMALCLGEMLEKLDLVEVDILAVGSAAHLAQLLQREFSQRVNSQSYLATSPILDEQTNLKAVSGFTGRMQPHITGSQFVAAHGMAKQSRLFWNWATPDKAQAIARDRALDPAALHQVAFDALRTRIDLASILDIAPMENYDPRFVFSPDWALGGEPLSKVLAERFDQVVSLPKDEANWAGTIIKTLGQVAPRHREAQAAHESETVSN